MPMHDVAARRRCTGPRALPYTGRLTPQILIQMASAQFRSVRCTLPGVHAVEACSDHSFSRHTHEEFGIGLFARGAQKSFSGRGMVEAGAGDLVTVNPGEVHDGMPIGDGVRSWRMLYLDPRVVGAAVRDVSEGRLVQLEFSEPVMHDARLPAAFAALYRAVTEPQIAAAGLAAEQELLRLMAQTLCWPGGRGAESTLTPASAPASASARVRAPGPAGILRARELIDDDPLAELSLDDLAQAAGISRFHLVRAFGRATGLTPHAYLVQRRIAMARVLIARGTPLAEAAAASGFADQSHMTRIFVRKYGIAPAAYARACA